MKNIRYLDDGDDDILRDGETLIVPMWACDDVDAHNSHINNSVRHCPGFVRDARNGSERQAIYDQYDNWVSSAWKNPTTDRRTVGRPERQDDSDRQERPSRDGPQDARQAAYAEYDRHIANAWRGGGK